MTSILHKTILVKNINLGDFMKKICCIISAGDVNLSLLKEKKSNYDFFIAADLGFEKAKEAGIIPALLVGDFDSISHFPSAVKKIQFPIEKDYSDTQLAIEEGIKLGFTSFHIYGALGGDRFSHSIANLQTLCLMKSKGVSVTLIGEKEMVYLIKNESLTLTPPIGSTFSVFSMSDKTTGVSITGAKYPLENAILTHLSPLGLSNQSVEQSVTIKTTDGYLLVILEF